MLQTPGVAEALGGDLAEQAERSLVRAASGDDLALREALLRKLELMRQELAGPNPSPLERLLVGRVAACWLHLHYAEMLYAQNMGKLSAGWEELHQRRISHAHRRYLAAIKTLATVRKLAVPVLQVNIARRQVNVAGVCPAAAGAGDDP
jgi:hypothetical protein